MTDDLQVESGPQESGAGTDGHVLALAKGAGISLVGRIFGRGLLLFGQAILARSLGRDGYGLFSIGWSVLQISLFASPIGLQHGVIRFGARSQEDPLRFRRILQQTIFMALVSGLLSGALLYLFSPQLALLFDKPGLDMILRGTAIAMFLSVLIRVAAAATRISQRVQFSAIAEDFLPAFLLALGAFLLTVVWQGGVQGGMTSVVLAYAVSALAAFAFLFRLYPDLLKPVTWERPLFREIAAFSVPTALAGTLIVLIQWVTRLVLGILRPADDVGLYQAASQLASALVIMQASVAAIFTPMISRLAGQNETGQMNDLYKVATKWSLYVSAPIFLVMMIFPSNTMQLVFGAKYLDGAVALIILSLGQLVNIATGAVGPLTVMLNRQNQFLRIQFVALAITLLLNFWWIPAFGVVGAAVGNSIGIAVGNLGSMIDLRRATGLWPYDRRYVKGLLATLTCSLALLALHYFIPVGWIVLFAAGALAVIVFAFTLWRAGLDAEDIQFLSAVRKRLPF